LGHSTTGTISWSYLHSLAHGSRDLPLFRTSRSHGAKEIRRNPFRVKHVAISPPICKSMARFRLIPQLPHHRLAASSESKVGALILLTKDKNDTNRYPNGSINPTRINFPHRHTNPNREERVVLIPQLLQQIQPASSLSLSNTEAASSFTPMLCCCFCYIVVTALSVFF
jgi:hypothetical protein